MSYDAAVSYVARLLRWPKRVPSRRCAAGGGGAMAAPAFARAYFDLEDAPPEGVGGDSGTQSRRDQPQPPPTSAQPLQRCASALRRGIIGAGTALRTPFGARRMAYADWAASGRALAPVEDFLRRCGADSRACRVPASC